MTRRKYTIERHVSPPPAVSPGARPAAVVFHADRLRPLLLGGLMTLCVARPLYPSESAAFDGDGVTIVMLWIALAVFWLLGTVGRPEFSVRFGWLDAAVLLLVGWHTVAALWATQHGSPRPAANMLWEWVGLGLCYLLARQFIATAREARAVAAVMVALAVALSGYGLYQCAYEMPQTRAKYRADPDRALRDAGYWFPPDSPERKSFADRLNNVEPSATFALTNSLAAFLAPWLVMLVGMGFGAGLTRRRWFGMLLCLIPIAVCLLMTKSRSGYIAAGVGLALVWLWRRERTVRVGWKTPAVILTVAAVLVAAVIAGGRLNGGLLGRAAKSFGYRLQYWQSSLHMIADHPLIGCGPGNFQSAYTHYKLPEASEEVADPHNFLLEIWATAGTPAALAFLAVLAGFAWAVARGQGPGASGPGNEGKAEGGSRRAEETPDAGPPATYGSAPPDQPSAFRIQPSSSNPQSPVPSPSRDAWLYVLLGSGFGFLVSLPVGMLSAAPPGWAAVLLGLPLAAVAVVLMLGWIENGQMSRWLPAVGVVVLLVDLLAAGGIGFPGVAGTLWLLLALGLQGEQPRALPVAGAWAALLVALALAVACYGTAYSPVLGCQGQLWLAEREPARAVEHLEAAAAADPWAAEPWRQLAAIWFEAWWRQPSEDAFRRFERTEAKSLELAPNAAPAWLAAGDWYYRASSQTHRGGATVAGQTLDKAVAAYRHAVQLYPNIAVYRAKLAVACRAAGDRAAFRDEAEAALRLDEATPHADKKLPAEMRDRLVHGLRKAR
jgi:O-antigen ligase